MQTYPSSDITRRSREILKQAEHGPVSITHYREPAYVIMSAEHYERITAKNPRTVHSLKSVSPEMREEMLAAIDRVLSDE